MGIANHICLAVDDMEGRMTKPFSVPSSDYLADQEKSKMSL